jgi:hypothetical protein
MLYSEDFDIMTFSIDCKSRRELLLIVFLLTGMWGGAIGPAKASGPTSAAGSSGLQAGQEVKGLTEGPGVKSSAHPTAEQRKEITALIKTTMGVPAFRIFQEKFGPIRSEPGELLVRKGTEFFYDGFVPHNAVSRYFIDVDLGTKRCVVAYIDSPELSMYGAKSENDLPELCKFYIKKDLHDIQLQGVELKLHFLRQGMTPIASAE